MYMLYQNKSIWTIPLDDGNYIKNNYYFLHIYLDIPNKCVIFVIEIK